MTGKIHVQILLVAVMLGPAKTSMSQDKKNEKEILKDTLLVDEVVVSAQRHGGPLSDRPEAVSTWKAEDFNMYGSQSLPDALEKVVGIWMQKTNHGGGSPFIRGLTGYQTLLLIDGIRFNNSIFRSGPNQYLNTIDPYSIQRVEVLRGQGSVQFGTDAVGGAINMFTSTPKLVNEGTHVRSKTGGQWFSHRMEYTGRAEAEVSGRRAAVLAGASWSSFGDIVTGGKRLRQTPTGFSQKAADAKVLISPTDGQLLTLAFNWLAQQDVPLYHKLADGKYLRYHFSPQDRMLGYMRLNSKWNKQLFQESSLTFSWQGSGETRSIQKANEDLMYTQQDKIKTLSADFNFISTPRPFWNISSGLEFYRDKVNSGQVVYDVITGHSSSVRGLYPDLSNYINASAYTLHHLNIGVFNLTGGLRYNTINMKIPVLEFGETKISTNALVGNIGVRYSLVKSVDLSGTINNSFRAPNINDVASLGVADFRYEVPNHNLKAEKGLNKELGLHITKPKINTSVYLFHNLLSELITNQPATYNGLDSIDGYRVYQRTNSNKAFVRGAEITTAIKPDDQWDFHGFLVYTFGQDETKNEPMRRIPPLYGQVSMEYQTSFRLKLYSVWRMAGLQDRLSSGDEVDSRIAQGGTAGWKTWEVGLGFKQKQFVVRTGVRNILNEHYRVHGSGIDAMGRIFWANVFWVLPDGK